MKLLPYTILVFIFINYGSSAKILGIFPMTVHSHFTLGFRIMKELADRGHEVYFINPYPPEEKVNNLTYIHVPGILEAAKEYKKNLFKFGEISYFGKLDFTREMGVFMVRETLKNQDVQKLLHSDEHFDLVLLKTLFTEALSIFAYKFKCPLVLLAPSATTMFNNYLFANPSPSSYVPNLLSGYVAPLNIWERAQNLFYDITGQLYKHLIFLPQQNAMLKKYVKDAPELNDILYNASLMLVASHVSLFDPVPLQPNIKEIGGYHVNAPKPLPSDIQEYLDGAKEGVVLFSMGSNLRTADIPKEKLEAVLKSLSKLKEKVLWKFEEDLPGKPDNVKIMAWLPQSDILAHPNVKVFIGHGGILSTTEAVYHGVPIVGVPVFFDQQINIKNAEAKGFALSVPFAELNEERFSTALNEIINNPSYKDNAKLRCRIMHSDPVKQIDAAVFWIEYVIEFKGAPHLRSAGLDLWWYQILSIDIFIVLIVLVIIFHYIIRKILNLKKVVRKIKKS